VKAAGGHHHHLALVCLLETETLMLLVMDQHRMLIGVQETFGGDTMTGSGGILDEIVRGSIMTETGLIGTGRVETGDVDGIPVATEVGSVAGNESGIDMIVGRLTVRSHCIWRKT
jgi:hypothetical protein